MQKFLKIIGIVGALSGLILIVVKMVELKCALREIGEAVKETDFSGISL